MRSISIILTYMGKVIFFTNIFKIDKKDFLNVVKPKCNNMKSGVQFLMRNVSSYILDMDMSS